MFKQRLLKHIFILSCLLGLAYPLVHIWIIFPVYQKILVQYTEDDAFRVASHVVSTFAIEERGFTRESLPKEIAEDMEKISREFIIEKIKIFSAAGEVIFSTSGEDVGKMNTYPYFHEEVSKGRKFTKFVVKDTPTMEGRKIKADVVETYIPVMVDGNFLGALEIYYDVTSRNQALKSAALLFSALPFGLTLFFLMAVIVIVLRAGGGSYEDVRLPKTFQSPGYLLGFSAVTIFLAEAVVLVLFSALPPMDLPLKVVLNATLLVMVAAPGIYFFFLEPLFQHMAEQKRVEKKLEELSTTDELTRLLNRRGFFTLAGKLIASARRAHSSIIMVFADLNNLKWINDNFGHETGNRLLMEAAAILQETFRDTDVIARIGGDEFAVCALNNKGENGVEAIERRLKTAVQAHNEKMDRNYQLSLSIGVTAAEPNEHWSVEDLLCQADALMYKDKEKYRKLKN